VTDAPARSRSARGWRIAAGVLAVLVILAALVLGALRVLVAQVPANADRVQAWIEQDLASEDASTRLLAASALSSLGRAARGAPLLVDKDPRVRARAACTMLLARHVR